MSGGIQGIDKKVMEKTLVKFSKKQINIGIIGIVIGVIGIGIAGASLILPNFLSDDTIIIERTIENKEIQLPAAETPPTSIEVLKTDDGYALSIIEYFSVSESTVTNGKVAEKIIQSP